MVVTTLALVATSKIETELDAKLATHTRLFATAIPYGIPPTVVEPIIAPVAASKMETLALSRIETKARPFPKAIPFARPRLPVLHVAIF